MGAGRAPAIRPLRASAWAGINWTFPGFDRLVATVDMRIRSTPFQAEKTLTKDTVPVNVDAVLFWVVNDARKAVVEVEHYAATVSWAAQTTLRDVIGHTELVGMIADREQVDRQLQEIIDAKTSDWGITVQPVEIRDFRLPGMLEDAMSRKAQADRESEARVILHIRSWQWLTRWSRRQPCTYATPLPCGCAR